MKINTGGTVRTQEKQRYPKPGRIFFLIIIVLFSQYIFIQSTFFSLQRIIVSGNNLLSTDSIIRNIGVPIGSNIFFVNSRTVEENLLGSFYEIKKVKVKFGLPDNIFVAIEERTYSITLLKADTIYAADEDGVVLYEINDPELAKSPVITFDGWNLSPGTQVKGVQWDNAILALPVIRQTFPDAEIAMTVGKSGDIDIELESSIKVKLGSPKDLKEKLSLLPPLQKAVEGEKMAIQYIDLRFKNTPVIKTK